MLREKRRHANSKPNRKLDRKSSRGMIYENEELRLRTININAEVERGQSDIKKLRRENDHLRREIWSLRDEYDRLDKLLRANPQQGVDIGERPTPAERTIVYEEGDEEEEDDEEEEGDEDEEEEQICEHCQQYEESCECTLPDKINAATAAPFRPRPPPRDRTNFDDLSVVSEETTHSTDTVLTDPDTQRLSLNAPSLGAFEYQSNVPSLSHFENLCYERIGPNLSASGELVYEAGHSGGSGGGGGGSAGTATTSDGAASLPQSPSVSVPAAFQDETNTAAGAGSGPPDICMYTAGMPMRMRPRSGHYHNGSAGRFSTGGNLDDLLHDLDNLSVDHSLTTVGDKRRKQRSEMNLILSHDGAISSISSTPVTPAAIPISVDTPSPQQPLPEPPPPPIGWKPELPPKPDKPPKPKFPWIGRAGTTVQPTQSAQQIRRKSITAAAEASGQQLAVKAPATATISKRRFSLRRPSFDAIAAAKPPVVPTTTTTAAGGGVGAGSSAERTTTTHGSVSSSSPESSTSISLRSQRPQPRRISTGSHDNATGSIPWCACWGNGCI